MNTKSGLTMRDAVLSFYVSLSSTSWFKSGQVWVEFSDISNFPILLVDERNKYLKQLASLGGHQQSTKKCFEFCWIVQLQMLV